jgi:hypothetical protein
MSKLNIATVESLDIDVQTETGSFDVAPSAVTGPSAVFSNASPPAAACYDYDWDYGYYYYHGRNSRARNQAPLS